MVSALVPPFGTSPTWSAPGRHTRPLSGPRTRRCLSSPLLAVSGTLVGRLAHWVVAIPALMAALLAALGTGCISLLLATWTTTVAASSREKTWSGWTDGDRPSGSVWSLIRRLGMSSAPWPRKALATRSERGVACGIRTIQIASPTRSSQRRAKSSSSRATWRAHGASLTVNSRATSPCEITTSPAQSSWAPSRLGQNPPSAP
mmetsp:Transcript_60668/g.123800  ORF Transcript_60668/g.123800 Transcript_60668/m.123800 type:complete len:203 (-) Transcript_60668:150-758(-)